MREIGHLHEALIARRRPVRGHHHPPDPTGTAAAVCRLVLVHLATSKRFSTLITTAMGRPAIPPQPDFLVQLRRTQHAVRTRLDADLGPTGLTTPQYAVLETLKREGKFSASDLALEFGMTAQTLNVLVKPPTPNALLPPTPHLTHP